MSCVHITNHAIDRTHERVGLPKRAGEKNAERAYLDGIKHSETSGSLRRFIDSLYLKQKKANNIRIYCGNVYLFSGTTLITIIPLPPKHRKSANDARKKRQKFD